MTTFATTYVYAPDSDAARDATRPAHRAFLADLTEQGVLVISGPYVGDPAGALLVLEGDSVESVRAVMEADPFVAEGLVAEVVVREWTTVSGRLASHF